MSNVYWAFKNSFKDFNTITFEGPVIQCIDLKRAILQKTRTQSKEIDQLNYGLTIHNAQTGEEYRNDNHYINRNTSVIVKRVPVRSSDIQKLTVVPQIKLLPTIKNGVVKSDPFGKPIYGQTSSKKTTPDLDVEKSKIFEVMKATAPARHENDDNKYRQKKHWKAKGSKPPSNYTCFTCNTPGHWIWDCPKKNDPVKSIIEKPPIQEETNYLEIALKRKHGLLDDPKQKSDVFKPYSCALCKNLYRKPTLTPCCKFTYCDECIRQYLIENHRYTCPSCEERINVEDLTLNTTLHKKIQAIKEKLGDPKAEPKLEEIQAMFPARNFQPNTFNDLRVDPISIVCLHCSESGHMFKDCPKKDTPIVKQEPAVVKKETTDAKPETPAQSSLPSTLLQNQLKLPNLLTNPTPAAVLPTGLQMPSLGALNGGLHGGSHLPSLSTFLYMQKLMKKKKKKSRSESRSRERRRRRDRRRRRSRSYSSSRERSDSRGRSRRDRGRRRRRHH